MGSEAMSIGIPMLDLMFFLTETQDNPRHVGAARAFRNTHNSVQSGRANPAFDG